MSLDFRRFDIYRKIPKDLTQPTKTGAVISIASISFILYLLIAEFMSFMSPSIVTSIVVDDPKKTMQMIPVLLRVSVYNISCDYLGIDIQDDVGRHEIGHREHTQRHRINSDKGCYLIFKFSVNKNLSTHKYDEELEEIEKKVKEVKEAKRESLHSAVSGNFHVSTHGAKKQPTVSDFSHTIHQLTIGDVSTESVSIPNVQTSFKPLENRSFISSSQYDVFDHYLKIVPSVYIKKRHDPIYPYQYTSMDRVYNTMTVDVGAAIWFRYDLLPITVQYREHYDPFYRFLTYMCGVVGGTFTVAGIIDSMIFSASQLYKKAEMDKLN